MVAEVKRRAVRATCVPYWLIDQAEVGRCQKFNGDDMLCESGKPCKWTGERDFWGLEKAGMGDIKNLKDFAAGPYRFPRPTPERFAPALWFNGCKRHSDCITCPFPDCMSNEASKPQTRRGERGCLSKHK